MLDYDGDDFQDTFGIAFEVRKSLHIITYFILLY